MQPEKASTNSDQPETVEFGYNHGFDSRFYQTQSEKKLNEIPATAKTTLSKNSKTMHNGNYSGRV